MYHHFSFDKKQKLVQKCKKHFFCKFGDQTLCLVETDQSGFLMLMLQESINPKEPICMHKAEENPKKFNYCQDIIQKRIYAVQFTKKLP